MLRLLICLTEKKLYSIYLWIHYCTDVLSVENLQALGHSWDLVVGPVGEDIRPQCLRDELVTAQIHRRPRAGVQSEYVAVPLPLPLQGLHRSAAKKIGVANQREARTTRAKMNGSPVQS